AFDGLRVHAAATAGTNLGAPLDVDRSGSVPGEPLGDILLDLRFRGRSRCWELDEYGHVAAVDDHIFHHLELYQALAQLRLVDGLQQLEDGFLVERGVCIGHVNFLRGAAVEGFPNPDSAWEPGN